MGMVSVDIQKSCPQFLLGFVLINAYVPGIIGASIPTGWLFLIIVSVLIIAKLEIKITELHIIGTLFFTYAILSLLWTPNLNLGVSYLLKIISLACVFCIASELKDIRWIIIGLAIGLLPSDILALIQNFYNKSYIFSMSGNIAGLFINPNIFCEVSAAILLCLIIFKLWWFIPLTLPGLILVHSRGALLGLAFGFFIWLFKKNRTTFYISTIVIIVSATLYYIDRFIMSSVTERFNLWADTINGFKFFGNGIGSFELLYPYYATYIDTAIARPKFAHNDLLHLVFELGLGTIFLFWFLYKLLKVNDDRNIILYGIGIMAMFSYTLNNSVTGFIWVLVAGNIARNMPSVWDSWDTSRLHIFKGFASART